MNSQERKEGRYQRRKAKRNKPGQKINFQEVYTMQNLQKATNECKNGVMWKQDPILYTTHAPVNNKRLKDSLMAGKAPQSRKIRTANIRERGKERHIRMVSFGDRVPQRCHCDNALLPALLPGLIYDNGASQKNKGVSFARRRVLCHLERAIRKNGVENTYVMLLDFKSFFDSISHQLCLNVLSKAFRDKMIIGLTMYYIKMYHQPDIDAIKDKRERWNYEQRLKKNQGKGCTLGSEISQVMAISTPNALDHMIKDECGIKPFERYMDDMMIIGTKETLECLYEKIKIKCRELGFSINELKTRICNVRKSFVFLKVRYKVSDSGKIIRRMAKSGIIRQRRKLKRFRRLVDKGKMLLDDVFESMQSWLGHAKGTKSRHARGMKTWHARKNMIKRYCDLFDGYRKEELAA